MTLEGCSNELKSGWVFVHKMNEIKSQSIG
jgi:hypothetical protein